MSDGSPYSTDAAHRYGPAMRVIAIVVAVAMTGAVIFFAANRVLAETTDRAAQTPAPSSAFLLRHADDAVDWQPWNADTAARAQDAGRPVVLLVGHLICRGCEPLLTAANAPETAALLNDAFVPVLVDRNERPDVALAYRPAGADAGEPLLVWLTPELRPFRIDAPADPAALAATAGDVARAWRDDRDRLAEQAQALATTVGPRPRIDGNVALTAATLDRAVNRLIARIGPVGGDVVGVPPAPSDLTWRLLLARAEGVDDPILRRFVAAGLRTRGVGAVTDPRLEPTLYNQAGLLRLLAEAADQTGDARFAAAAADVVAFTDAAFRDPHTDTYFAALDVERGLVDDKILTSWNGLMIGALARAGDLLGQHTWVTRASRAADFLLAEVRRDGELYHLYDDGARVPGFQDDFAYLAWGLLDLYRATGDRHWLEAATTLTRDMHRLFDDPAGGYFYTRAGHDGLLTRGHSYFDTALPSGNSVAAQVLIELAELHDDPALLERAVQTINAFLPLAQRTPRAFPNLLLAAHEYITATPPEPVMAAAGGRRVDADARPR